MNTIVKQVNSVIILGLILCLVSGCASTKGSINEIAAPVNNDNITKYGGLVVQVIADTKTGSEPKLIVDEAASRIKDRIVNGIKKEAPHRFTEINAAVPGPQTILSNIRIKNFEEGNAFARFMMAGLGQMHIDADVDLSDYKTHEALGKYEVTKTFAWGGLYGASQKITDIEEGFSDAVIETILRVSK
ncbi:MAG: DUF4410 domain-containing protein [Methylococcales bacterium]